MMITSLLVSLWGRIQKWVMGGVAVVAALGSVFLLGRSQGKGRAEKDAQVARQQAENAALNDGLDAVKERNRVEEEIAHLPAGESADRLFRDWSRDKDGDRR